MLDRADPRRRHQSRVAAELELAYGAGRESAQQEAAASASAGCDERVAEVERVERLGAMLVGGEGEQAAAVLPSVDNLEIPNPLKGLALVGAALGVLALVIVLKP